MEPLCRSTFAISPTESESEMTSIIPGNIYQKGQSWFCRGIDSDSVDLPQFSTEIGGEFCFLTMEVTHSSEQNFTLWGHRTEEACKKTFRSLLGRATDDVDRSGANLPYTIKCIPTTVETGGREGNSILVFPSPASFVSARAGIKGILLEFLNDETQRVCFEVLASSTKATETGKLPDFLQPYAPSTPSAPLEFLERV